MELPLGTVKTSELAGGVSPQEASLGATQSDLLNLSSDTPKPLNQDGGKKSADKNFAVRLDSGGVNGAADHSEDRKSVV